MTYQVQNRRLFVEVYDDAGVINRGLQILNAYGASTSDRVLAVNAAAAAAVSAAAAAVSTRFDVNSFAELATKFVLSAPGPGQQIVAAGDLTLWRGEDVAFEVVASGGDLNYTATGGVRFNFYNANAGVSALLTTGDTEANLAAWNASVLQKIINRGFSVIEIPSGTYPCGPLKINAGQSLLFRTASGTGGTPTRRTRLRAPAGQTDHMIELIGAGSRLRFEFFDISGNKENNPSATFAGIKANDIPASERASLYLAQASIRDMPGIGVDIGKFRDSWVITDHSVILDCGLNGVRSIGAEDPYFSDSECGQTGETAFYIDGLSDRLIGNVRLTNFDIFRGGSADPGEVVANTTVGVYDNIHIGGWVSNSKLMGGDTLGAFRHGLSYGLSGASPLYAGHVVSGVRFTANSRQTTGRYSDVYSRTGHVSLVAPIFTTFEILPPSQTKNLVEVSSELGAAAFVMVVAPQWRAPAVDYAGSYISGGAKSSNIEKIQWIDSSELRLNRGQVIRKNVSGSEDVLVIEGAGGNNQFRLVSSGSILWGNGTDAADVQMYRESANRLELAAGDSFRALGGFGSSPVGAAPASPFNGQIAHANGAVWDPLATGGAAGSYYVWWTGSVWRGLHETGNGTDLP